MILIGRKYIDFYNFNSKYDRINGPAYIRNKEQLWIRNGKYHRINGPAHISIFGDVYYIENIKYNETEYNKKIQERLLSS